MEFALNVRRNNVNARRCLSKPTETHRMSEQSPATWEYSMFTSRPEQGRGRSFFTTAEYKCFDTTDTHVLIKGAFSMRTRSEKFYVG